MMRFEWDDRKARSNARKHGVTFEQAVTVFDDPGRWFGLDPKHSSPSESREWLIGAEDGGRLLVLTFTRKQDGVIRLISARLAGRRDRRKYEEGARNKLPMERSQE